MWLNRSNVCYAGFFKHCGGQAARFQNCPALVTMLQRSKRVLGLSVCGENTNVDELELKVFPCYYGKTLHCICSLEALKNDWQLLKFFMNVQYGCHHTCQYPLPHQRKTKTNLGCIYAFIFYPTFYWILLRIQHKSRIYHLKKINTFKGC